MRVLLTVFLLLFMRGAIADCFVRTSIKLDMKKVHGELTDFQSVVFPLKSRKKCVVQYRANVLNQWRTYEGVGYGKSDQLACAQAQQASQGYMLADVGPQKISSQTQMVCSDFEKIHVHPVRIGDLVWESETELHSVAAERPRFIFKSTACRMFVERDARQGDLVIYQGVICKQHGMEKNSKWLVVDKY